MAMQGIDSDAAVDAPVGGHTVSLARLHHLGIVDDDRDSTRPADHEEHSLVALAADLHARIQQVRTARIDADAVQWEMLGELLRRRRIELSLSQDEVAGAIDSASAAVASVEAATMRLTVDGFVAYCQALHLDPSLVLRHAIQ